MSEPLLEAEDLTVQYRTNAGMLTAVSDASFTIQEQEYFGLVGESGCGKSTIAKAIMGGLDENGQVSSGKIKYKGQEIQDMTQRELNEEIRWKEISWIPQGSMSSLEPLQRVEEQAVEIGGVHTDLSDQEIKDRLRDLFGIVGLPPGRATDYPHQFSGGMQQRALIAFALLLEPSLIIADEPTTALDVIMQDQVFKYLDEIKESDEAELGMGMILITHDISVVFESCDKMAVMHSGQVSETGSVEAVFDQPHHPYAILLQEAFPDVRYPNRDLGIIEGTPPQNIGEVDYCTFADRCPWAVEECSQGAPPLEQVEGSEAGHQASCIRKDEVRDLYRAEQRQEESAPVEGDS